MRQEAKPVPNPSALTRASQGQAVWPVYTLLSEPQLLPQDGSDPFGSFYQAFVSAA